jgi:hypothetical protein
MTPKEFEARIVAWAQRQADITALILIGSRTQDERSFDQWSDWDFHLITTRPQKYHGTHWLPEIAPPWCARAERSIRGRMKVSAIFEGGLEADFVPLSNWQMELVYWGMRRPHLARCMPASLLRGILETRTILSNSGYRILIGGEGWSARLGALTAPWRTRRMSATELAEHSAAFWQQAVWITKKIARPEPRSAAHWLHRLILGRVYALLEEEAWLADRKARPEALKAEKWLDERRLAQTRVATDLEPRTLARALLAQVDLFEELARGIAATGGYTLPDY